MKTKFSGILTLFLAFVVQFSFAQEKTISGTISDESGLPLPGVNILVKGTTNGTQTDFDGNYSIMASVGDAIVYSFVGYQTVEETVGAGNTISFSMSPDVSALEEVVITALGIKRKQDEITTANQVVKTEEIVKANNPTVLQGLTGKVSGLQINTINSGVNAQTRIVLRGNRSISGDNEALIVIDGVISTQNFLQTLDPNNIESVNVIKGPNGAALYGSQGANGVIMVSTKKGSDTGNLTINVKSSIDFETVYFVPERQTRYGQGWDIGNGFENIIYENGGWGAEFDGQVVPVGLPQADGTFIMAPYSTRGNDHIKEFFNTGETTQNSFNISVGDSEGYLSLNGLHRETEFVIKNDKLKNNTFTFQGGKTLGKWAVSGSATYSNTNTKDTYTPNAADRIYRQLLQTASNIPIREFANSGNEGHWNGYFTNPYWNRDNQRRETDAERFNIQGEIKYAFNSHIDAILRSSGLFTNTTTLTYQNEYIEPAENIAISGYDRSLSSYFTYGLTGFKRYYTDFLVNFDYMLTDDISFKANIGGNSQYTKSNFTQVGGTDLTVPGIYTSSNLNGGFDDSVTGDGRSSYSSLSAFGNIDIGYKDFLFLNVTGRNDWTSVLNKDNNSFFYPSAGISFIPTKAFDFGGDILNYAKLSASYVKVGSVGSVGAYDIQSVYNQGGLFPIGDQNSFVQDTSVTDPLIEPEFTTSYEFGVNLGFLKDRITLDASYSAFKTDNQITTISTSATSGLSTSRINLAETKGTALEVDLGLKVIQSEDIDWNLRVGYQTTDNEVVKVSDQADQVSLGGFIGFAEVFAIEGQPFPVIQSNYYERDPQGRILVDGNGNLIEASGLSVQGRTTPDYIINFNTAFRFKDFTLAATMDYRTGHVFYADSKGQLSWSGHLVESAQTGRSAFIYPNTAVETSPGVYEANTTVPSGGVTAGSYITFWNAYRNVGENFVLDATAFKIRELSLTYDMDPKLLRKTFVTGLSISAIGRNILTVLPAENRGYSDPEYGFSAGNAAGITTTGNYPSTRSWGMGISVTF